MGRWWWLLAVKIFLKFIPGGILAYLCGIILLVLLFFSALSTIIHKIWGDTWFLSFQLFFFPSRLSFLVPMQRRWCCLLKAMKAAEVEHFPRSFLQTWASMMKRQWCSLLLSPPLKVLAVILKTAPRKFRECHYDSRDHLLHEVTI